MDATWSNIAIVMKRQEGAFCYAGNIKSAQMIIQIEAKTVHGYTKFDETFFIRCNIGVKNTQQYVLSKEFLSKIDAYNLFSVFLGGGGGGLHTLKNTLYEIQKKLTSTSS